MLRKKQQKQILIIEDESDLLKFSSWLLEAEGYKTLQAADGEEGIKIARQQQVDMILLDIRLPHRYGWDIMAEIKSTPDLRHIPIVVFTASADIEYKDKAFKMGAVDFLVKPVSAETLRKCVAAVFKNG